MPESLMDAVLAAQQFAHELDWANRRQFGPQSILDPADDRNHSGAMHRQDLGRTAKVFLGHVVDTIASCNWYKVQPEGARTTIPCNMMSQTSMAPFGVREHHPLHPNARVWFILHPGAHYGSIIGVEPSYHFDPRVVLSDYISMASRSGIQVDQCHQFPFTLPKNGTITDWSAGRPVDGTSAGERGWFAETGVATYVDSFMAYLRSDENTGVWAFYHDQLLRLAGQNLQLRTGGSELEALDDEGEVMIDQGYAGYPWETLGALNKGTTIHVENDATKNQVREPWYSRFEPLHDDQQPFFRLHHYYGYLGDLGGKRVLAAPPKNVSDVMRYSSQANLPGLFEEQIQGDGEYRVRSAKSVSLSKHLLNPVAKRLRRPEDATGDSFSDYKASGAWGDGDEHKVAGSVETQGNHPIFNRMLGITDSQAYSGNWKGQTGFHYHKKDFHLPEESQLKNEIGASNGEEISFGSLTLQSYLEAPAAVKMKIDHRYKEVSYYPNESHVEPLEDGGVSIADGFGSEIRMTGGSIFFSCPGDLIFQSGRRTVTMAGHDCIIRANNCIDLSATRSDVRVKAGASINMLAKEGVLIESEAMGTDFTQWKDKAGSDCKATGIMLKAASSNFTVWSEQTYIRAGVRSPIDSTNNPGSGIYLDSGQGEGNITIVANTVERFIMTGAFDWFTENADGSVSHANVYGPQANIFGAPLLIDGSITVAGSALVEDWVYSVSGHFGSALSKRFFGLVGELKEESLDRAVSAIESCKSAQAEQVERGTEVFAENVTEFLYAENQQGNDETCIEVTFSFRSQPQYKTEDFYLYESRWQQMARLRGETLETWRERPKLKDGEHSYPFPGAQKQALEDAFYTQDFALFDFAEGVSKDRSDSEYENPKFKEPKLVNMQTNYKVIPL